MTDGSMALNKTMFNQTFSSDHQTFIERKLAKPVEAPGRFCHWGDHTLNQDYSDLLDEDRATPAAVLIGIQTDAHGHSHMILTQRSQKLRVHSGQIALPGGKIDATDRDEYGAALREAQEEIGLSASQVRLMGRLPDYYTGSGYCVTAVVGYIEPGVVFAANPDEVECCFKIPISPIMEASVFNIESRIYKGKRRYYYVLDSERFEATMPDGARIWGVTAGILNLFRTQLMQP